MPSSRQIEVAAEHAAILVFDAVRTRRVSKTRYGDEDFFGADVEAVDEDLAILRLQAMTDDQTGGNVTKRRKRLERLAGPDFIPVQAYERRLLLRWQSRRDPEDGRRTVHRFHVQELVAEMDAEAFTHLDCDGRSRRPEPGWVWADWTDPIPIDKDTWYSTEDLP